MTLSQEAFNKARVVYEVICRAEDWSPIEAWCAEEPAVICAGFHGYRGSYNIDGGPRRSPRRSYLVAFSTLGGALAFKLCFSEFVGTVFA